MKLLITAFATLISTQAFASTYSLVSSELSKPTTADLCAEEIEIATGAGKKSMTITGNTELAMRFNLRSKEGDNVLAINSINGATLKESHTTFAHGERITTRTKATLKGNDLLLITETKFGTILTSKSEGRLEINFKADGLTMKIDRSYDEPFSSSADWATSQVCEYKLVK